MSDRPGILVPVKRVIDFNVRVRVRSDGSGVDLSNVKMAMNPFDEVAVEEALRLREAGLAGEVIVVSLGVEQARETLRSALAMGADRAILVVTGDDPQVDVEPLAVARVLGRVAVEEGVSLVLCGKQAIDNDMNATPQMLAGMLGWGQATFASRIGLLDGRLSVVREVDGGMQTLGLQLPAVVSVDLRLNEPRYASLPNIMKARRKPLVEKTPADWGIDISPRLDILATRPPEERKAGRRVSSVDELLACLKETGVI